MIDHPLPWRWTSRTRHTPVNFGPKADVPVLVLLDANGAILVEATVVAEDVRVVTERSGAMEALLRSDPNYHNILLALESGSSLVSADNPAVVRSRAIAALLAEIDAAKGDHHA